MLIRLLTAVGVAAVVFAPVASADSTDVQFVNTLTLNELGCTAVSFIDCGAQGEESLIELGQETCRVALSHGLDEDGAVATVIRAVAMEGPDKFPLTREKATVFVRASEAAYCPGRLRSS